MRQNCFRCLQWFLLTGFLLVIWGCASLTETLPAPPAFLTPLKLHGPYDADIPFRESSAIRKASLMDDRLVPYLFMRVANHFEKKGDLQRSVHFFNQAMDEFRKRNNVPGEGTAFYRKISALINSGRTEAAFLALEEMAKKWTDFPCHAFILCSYGYYYLNKGDYTGAQKYFMESLARIPPDSENIDWLLLRRDAAVGCGMAVILADYLPAAARGLSLLGFDETFYQDVRSKMADCLPQLEQIPTLNRDIRHTTVYRYFPEILPPPADCDAYNLLGLAHAIAGRPSEAVKHLHTALSLAKKDDYRLGEADNIFFFSHLYLLDRNPASGIQAAQALDEIAARYQMVAYSIWAKIILAHQARQTGDIGRTIQALDGALALWEENASWISCEKNFRGIRVFSRQTIYETLLDFHVAGGDEKGAFQTAERSKGAFLAERLSSAKIGKTDIMLARIGQIHALRQTMEKNYGKLMSGARGSAFSNAVEKIQNDRKSCRNLLTGIQTEDEALYALIGVAPSRVDEIQRLLDHNTTLFTYYVGEESLYIWAVSKNGFHQEKIRMSRREVDRLVEAWLNAMTIRDKGLADTLGEKVYDTFLKPVIPFVYGDRVGFVSHGTLHNLPFAAMRYVKSYLVDGFSIFQVPHTGILKFLLTDSSMLDTGQAIVLTDESCIEKPYPVTRATPEIDTFKKVYPQAADVVLNNFSVNDLQKLSGNYDIIKVVMQNDFRDPFPAGRCGRSADQPQTGLADVFRLRTRGRLTLLSNCRFGQGRWTTEAGETTLTGAWLYAVSPQMLMKLWNIEEKAEKVFWRTFFENRKKGIGAADALRAAQNGMIHAGYGPSDWAAFILTGRY